MSAPLSPACPDCSERPAFRRPVSPTEWLYLAGTTPGAPLVIQVCVEGDGAIGYASLERAVAEASRACPGARLVREGRWWTDSGTAPAVRVLEPGSAALRAGLPPGGPTCEVLLAGSTVVFRAHHAVMDGRGVLRWAAEVFRALRGEPPTPARATDSDFTLLARLGGGRSATPRLTARSPRPSQPARPTASAGSAGLAAAIASAGLAASAASDGSVGSVSFGGSVGLAGAVTCAGSGGSAGLPGSVSSGGSAASDGSAASVGLAAAATSVGASGSAASVSSGGVGGFGWWRRSVAGVHPALVARVASVIAGASGLPRARIMVPVDLRRHDPGAVDSTANLALPLFLDARPGTPWEELHGRLLDALAAGEELAAGPQRLVPRVPLGALGGLVRALEAGSGRLDRHLCTALVSHLGRVDLAAFSAEGYTASSVYSLPVQAPFVPLSLVAVECLGRTEITLCRAGGPGADGAAEELLDRIEDTLSPREARLWPGGGSGRAARSADPTGVTLVDLFRKQVAQTPDAVALVDPDGTTSYAELDRRSDAVARELLDRGAGRGSVVGLLADRSAGAVAGLWGILKSGAAYLPLDPEYPDARTRRLLDDAGARLCLVRGGYADRVAGDLRQAVVLDDLPHRTPASPAPPALVPAARIHGDDLAYVLYTSGSTGQPKGVEVEHRQLANYVGWATTRYDVHGGTRFALFTSLAFDLTGTSIFLPLLAGGSIALVPGPVDHLTLRHVLRECGATALKLTPAHLDLIGRLGLAAEGVDTVVVGGEQLTGPVAAGAQRLFGPGCRIFNEYGPTEATIGCVVHRFDPGRDAESPAVPIGLPVENTGVRLLDADRGYVTPGETGEMYLVGDQLARGYRGSPDLDRERFVVLADGARAYRTGDLARLLPSGVLEYAGRADDQIKILGHRVEPAEIAQALEGHPSVARAFVVGRRPPGRDHDALCAYAVTSGPVGDDDLLGYLAGVLPRHLVPAAVVRVSGFPHTVNGKVDAAALPDPYRRGGGATGPGLQGTPEDARDEVERQVARVWAEVLGTGTVHVDQAADFYRAGGDSLSLLTLFAALADRFAGGAAEPRAHGQIMAELRGTVDRPRFDRVCTAVRSAVAAPNPNLKEH